MDALKALKALKEKMKKEKEELVGSDKKAVTKGELEAARLLKLRQEEEEERKRKELKRKLQDGEDSDGGTKAARKDAAPAEPEQMLPNLSREEVIRRLRALGHPATLFGEEDVDRLRRFLRVEKEVQVDDDRRGGQQENSYLELQRQEREKARQKAKELAAAKAADAAAAKTAGKLAVAADAIMSMNETSTAKAGHGVAAGPVVPDGAMQEREAAKQQQREEDDTLAAFKHAAAALAERRAEESMPVEDRIAHSIKKWMKEWEEDLDRRPDSIKATAVGHQASILFGQTRKYFEPLFERLKAKVLHEELRAGLWMMVQAMRDRNYLYANDIYLRLAIGNAPWPIGVTSVGIHERSAREKISHVMNASGQAHIMNDEATRKYLQALKRLIGAVQRLYPTVPSRSVDFETVADPGRGMSGAGSTKLALLEAEAKGETTETLGLPSAPHFLERDGKVMVPPKWKHILAAQGVIVQEGKASGREGSPAPPRTASPAPPLAAQQQQQQQQQQSQ